jgi:hypothetical protein
VQLAFDAPAETGGVPAGSLTYEVDTGSGWREVPGSRMLTGLRNGVDYSIRVRAKAREKAGEASSANATPFGPVPKPTASAGKPSPTQVTLSWNATTNGLPVTVTISINGGAKQTVGTSGSTTVGDRYRQNWTIVVESCASNGCKESSASASTDSEVADINGDGYVGCYDMNTVLADWDPNYNARSDFNRDGIINVLDMSYLLGKWLPVPGESCPRPEGVDP